MCHQGPRPANQMRFSCLHNVSTSLIILTFCTLSRKIMNRIPRGWGSKGRSGFIRAVKFCLHVRYQNCPQAHSLVQEPRQLFRFSTSFVDISSKVAEVLALMENAPQGLIRWTEPKPNATNTPAASGQLGFCCS